MQNYKPADKFLACPK